MKNEKLAKTLALKKIVKAIIENEPEFDNGMSYEEYCMKCDLNGVKCSFEDDNFMMFLFGKLGQDYEANIDFRNAMIDALNRFKLLDIANNKTHLTIAETVASCEIMRNHEYYKVVADYAIKNFKDTEFGQDCLRLAKAFGISDCSFKDIYGFDLTDFLGKEV